MHRLLGINKIYIPNPTWGNHGALIGKALCETEKYTYLGADGLYIDFEGMKKDFLAMPDGSVILLHACAHNPSGVDLNEEQWRELLPIFKKKQHLPYFDCAYQGFATGDLDKDAMAMRLFADEGIEFIICQSLSKNMGLYGERCGAIHIHTVDKETADRVASQVKRIVRATHSVSPCHGAYIASVVLGTPELFELFKEEVKKMAGRLLDMRKKIYDALSKTAPEKNWDHVIYQRGMFSFTGLDSHQVKMLADEYHIYMVSSGRMALTGLNDGNIQYVADSIKAVLDKTAKK
eukprot:gnl/Carplike_NY0171/682_a943_1637.p1 GENE.gnl/Carplike_NY0171/682_a943_1637~~gnl/Carplike_NY0171/682_a943_1637.p1  ORF type:complete len:291 (+),score=93.64 gnl/Carplike_NY0171/682_a943_1637:404-1276(+)